MDNHATIKIPEVWGGIECTINRVGNEFKDQLAYSGHYDRPDDLACIADLGIKVIRYPVLWEKHQRAANLAIDWTWTDRQLDRIRSSGMTPIAGLVHHGSGPGFTHLMDPRFPDLLASYAYEVASRYHWMKYYTPVNEPLTTARFSGLYGHWYPHHRSEVSFYKMLIHQLKATVLAMEAIRSVNPDAVLVQTEDLGKTQSTPLLGYQADFENVRRLLTFDILSGHVQSGHPHYDYLIGCGIKKYELAFFQEHTAGDMILGLNYYVTSERWLDESLENYDPVTHGGNGRHRYVDTEVVRVKGAQRFGLKKLATEIWQRYQRPMAITEVHLHCTREEQLRWFKEIWDDSSMLACAGVDIRGVTAWALLGSFDWDSLLTKTGTQYESGVFDIKTLPGQLRPTALASLIKEITSGSEHFHPVLSETGWWNSSAAQKPQPRFILIEYGDTGDDNSKIKLVRHFGNVCKHRRIPFKVLKQVKQGDLRDKRLWGFISFDDLNADIAMFCKRRHIQYVNFNKNDRKVDGLHIRADFEQMSIHQINKVLDLMIDAEQGNWVFDSGEIAYKKIVDRSPLADRYNLMSGQQNIKVR